MEAIPTFGNKKAVTFHTIQIMIQHVFYLIMTALLFSCSSAEPTEEIPEKTETDRVRPSRATELRQYRDKKEFEERTQFIDSILEDIKERDKNLERNILYMDSFPSEKHKNENHKGS